MLWRSNLTRSNLEEFFYERSSRRLFDSLIHSPLGFQQMVLCLLWLAPSLFLRMDSREYIVRPKKTEIPMAPHLELRSLWFILPAVTAITLNEK